MKTKIYFILLLSLFIIDNGCSTVTIFDDVEAQLEVIVKTTEGNLVKNANVSLYLTFEDWQTEENQVANSTTNADGAALFLNLEETTYYFYVKKDNQNNTLSTVTFSTPLKINQIKVIETIIN